jgi:hypothetical protein
MRVLTMALLVASQANAEPFEVNSGDDRVALVELYTSEGCNSCPPADRWLSKLKQDPALWSGFVPIAFHVDYWDYIGWKDRFAKAEFGHRQRRYAKEGGARFVYTPGMFRNGMEWQQWRRNASAVGKDDRVGNLGLRVEDRVATLTFETTQDEDRLSVHVAVLGMNLETEVRRGENAGKTLKHDFVVLDLRSEPLKYSEGLFTATVRLPAVVNSNPGQAIVAWVSQAGSQKPLQSVGGFFPQAEAVSEAVSR